MKALAVLLSLIGLTGCGALLARPDLAPQTFETYTKLVTPYEEWKSRMACVGNLVDAYLLEPVHFGIRTIRDNTVTETFQASEGIPKVNTYSLLQSFNMISPRVKAINWGYHEMLEERGVMLSAGLMPDFLVGGGVVSVDRVIVTKDSSTDVSLWYKILDDLRFQAKKTITASRIAIRLVTEKNSHAERFEAVHKANAGIDLVVWREGSDLGGSFGVYGFSAGGSVNLRKLSSMGAAVEQGLLFTTAVLVGKTLGVPYYQCLGGKVDSDVVDIVKHQFRDMSHQQKLTALANLLSYYGITVKLPEGPSDGIPESLRRGLAVVKPQHRDFTWSMKNPDIEAIYTALYFHLDMEKARKRHQQEREARQAQSTQREGGRS
ncbi:MAG: hypothetical protein U0236_22405 [Nitrospira sp.]